MKKPTIAAILSACAVCVIAAFGTPAASATVTGDNECPGQKPFGWYGDAVARSQEIPSRALPGESYPSTILRPADTATYPGPRPAIVVQHGRNGNRCSLWWIASYLAGHGYVTEVHSAPADPEVASAYAYALDASRSAFDFLKSPANPFAAITDTSRLGMTGHSLGSAVTSAIQAESDLGIDAVVASDNLRRYLQGDRGGSNQECGEPPAGEVTPRVPALGMAKDEPCNSAKNDTAPEIKLNGWNWWRVHRLPAMEVVMRGFEHGDFAGSGTETQKRDVSYFSEAWFDRWLGGEQNEDRLLAPEVNGRPTTEVLSGHYLSGACLPGGIDTADYAGWLASGSNERRTDGACGGAAIPEPPAPPTVPAPPKAAAPRGLKVTGAHRVRAGRQVRLTISIRNAGGRATGRVALNIRSSNRRARVTRRAYFPRAAPGKTVKKRIRVRTGRRARGRARITVRSAGMKRVFRIAIKAPKRR